MKTKSVTAKLNQANNAKEPVEFTPLLETMRVTRNKLMECVIIAEEINRATNGVSEQYAGYDGDFESARSIADDEMGLVNMLTDTLLSARRNLIG